MTKQNNILGYIYTLFNYHITNNDLLKDKIKSFDLFFDQFNSEDNGGTDSRSNPRILLEFTDIDFDISNNFGNIQTSEIDVNLHVGIDIFNNFNNTNENIDKNLAYLDLLNDIYKSFSNIYSSYNELPDDLRNDDIHIQDIERMSIIPATNTGAVKQNIISFRFRLEDYTNKKEKVLNNINYVSGSLNVSINGDFI